MEGKERGAQIIADEILKEAEEKSQEIIGAAKKEAKTIIEAALFRAREEEAAALNEAKMEGRRIYEEMIAAGKMKARKQILHRREELINSVLEQARRELESYVQTKGYEEDLVRDAISSCQKLGSDRVVIQANERDLKILERAKVAIESKISEGQKVVEVSFGPPIQTMGGLVAVSQDQKVVVDNTFEARLKREFDSLRIEIAKVLFEGSA